MLRQTRNRGKAKPLDGALWHCSNGIRCNEGARREHPAPDFALK
jgi:hypothetical protein